MSSEAKLADTWTAADKLAAVTASPEAVARHDKATWLGLFASDAEINDPVGSQPHAGEAAISRFYDTFIAPNAITFLPEYDVVCGDTVVRDLVISTTMSTGLQVDVSTHIRYELVEEGGKLKVRRLYAHWELLPMVMATLGKGMKGWWTYNKLSVHMIRCQGVRGVRGFMRGFSGIGSKGKQVASDWLDEQGLEWRKLISSGQHITATVEQNGKRGVAWWLFDEKGEVTESRIYWPDANT